MSSPPAQSRAPRSLLQRCFREPLFHFAWLALLVFALDAGLRTWRGAPELRLELAEQALGLDPDAPLTPEARANIDDLLMVREALDLGLDEGDPIVARRLRQKLLFLWEARARTEPTPDELRAWLAAHPEEFRRPARLSLRHWAFLQNDGQEHAERALGMLQDGVVPPAAQAFVHGNAFVLRTNAELDELFGAGFSGGLEVCEVGAWCGPVPSRFGAHVVMVEERRPGALPSLQAAETEVRLAWQQGQRQQARAEGLHALRRRAAVQLGQRVLSLEEPE